MSVQELSLVHRQYVELSDRFRAAWAYHQFVESLNKTLPEGERLRSPSGFQDVYAELKDISQYLNASHTVKVRGQLQAVERRLGNLIQALLAEDNRITPATLRQFFLRVKNPNSAILGQLVKFYLHAYEGGGWDPDRVDKADFLLTRIAFDDRGPDGTQVNSSSSQIRDLLRGLWQMTGSEEPSPDMVTERRDEIAAVRREAESIEDLDQLHRRNLISRYREIKHALGILFFHPDVLSAILAANLTLRERVQALYRQEEERLFSDYQRVFELEREVEPDVKLDQELADFRSEVERFEQRLRQDELSLDDLASLRERMRALLPRLRRGANREDEPGRLPEETRPDYSLANPVAQELLKDEMERIQTTLEGLSDDLHPQMAIHKPQVIPLTLEAREIVAFRRMAEAGGEGTGGEMDLIYAAALRLRMNDQVDKVRALMDDTSSTGEAEVYKEVRKTLHLSDEILHRFDHYKTMAVEAGDVEEAQNLQLLRMRLVREHSGLWLLVYRQIQRRP